MVHTVIEVMRMDKKFIAAVAVCFVALVGVATGTYFLVPYVPKRNLPTGRTEDGTATPLMY